MPKYTVIVDSLIVEAADQHEAEKKALQAVDEHAFRICEVIELTNKEQSNDPT